MKLNVTLCVCILLTSCSWINPTSRPSLSGIDGNACVGAIVKPPIGLREVHDNTLLQSALGASGKGMLCAGKVFEVEQPVVVYRVWDSSKTYTLNGRWWSLNIPQGPKDRYQNANDICPEWSALDRMSQCTLKPGAHIVIGPGQSATCATGLIPASATNQVYVPNDGQKNQLYIENCTQGTTWPQ